MRIERKNSSTVTSTLQKSGNLEARSSAHALPGTNEILALAYTPEVRAEQVARGKALVADPNYPSREQLKQVASLLAASWGRRASMTRKVATARTLASRA
jgi:hypothetical protein